MTLWTLRQRQKSGNGRFFGTGDDALRGLRPQGSFHELGEQYGALALGKMEPMREGTVRPIFDSKRMFSFSSKSKRHCSGRKEFPR